MHSYDKYCAENAWSLLCQALWCSSKSYKLMRKIRVCVVIQRPLILFLNTQNYPFFFSSLWNSIESFLPPIKTIPSYSNKFQSFWFLIVVLPALVLVAFSALWTPQHIQTHSLPKSKLWSVHIINDGLISSSHILISAIIIFIIVSIFWSNTEKQPLICQCHFISSEKPNCSTSSKFSFVLN